MAAAAEVDAEAWRLGFGDWEWQAVLEETEVSCDGGAVLQEICALLTTSIILDLH
jgi:hypothetical protein